MKNNPVFIDAFCGAGGLSLGLIRAGWKPALAFDSWQDAVHTYSHNLGNDHAVCADIADVDADFITERVSEPVAWVVGGPPCQGYSTVGRRDRNDPRNRLFEHFARIVNIIKPENFLIENVLGLRDMNFVDAVSDHFSEHGYKVSYFVATSADFGVPQLRRRVFFVGSRSGVEFAKPCATHTADRYVSVMEAIGDLPEVGPGEVAKSYTHPAMTEFQRMARKNSRFLQGHEVSKHPPHLVEAISYISDGGNRSEIPDRLQPKSGFHNSYSRLSSTAPAVAVTQNMGKPSGTRCIHPKQHRGLTTREGARLQGFPDTFHFTGGVTSQRLQVANAVSPILAEAIGKALIEPTNWGAELSKSQNVA